MLNYRFLRNLGLGVGTALIAMAVFPLLAKAARPILKSIIKGGLDMKDRIKEGFAEGKEKFEDVVAEVKEERQETGD